MPRRRWFRSKKVKIATGIRNSTGQATANCAWGGEDKSTLYITADMFLLRVKTKVKGF